LYIQIITIYLYCNSIDFKCVNYMVNIVRVKEWGSNPATPTFFNIPILV